MEFKIDDEVKVVGCADEEWNGMEGKIVGTAGMQGWKVQLSTFDHPLPFSASDLTHVEQTSSAA